jgi:D,D-heptose 1,7-bisphosphate phosphatase
VQPAIFLDRDNTLIANDGDLGDPAAVKLVDGVAAGLRHLREAGYRLIVVTNQAGVARGKFTEEDVDGVHQRIATLIDDQAGLRNGASHIAGLIDRFYYCPYHPEASVSEYRRDHPWRKPHPGMILQAARDMGLDLSRSWMVGDQERDILAGRAAGCRTILFSRDADLAKRAKPTDVAATFAEAVKTILQHKTPGLVAAHASPAAAGSGLAQPFPVPMPVPARSAPASIGQRANAASETDAAGMAGIRRGVQELTEEIRADRLRRSEFRLMTMLAALCQLLALTLGLLGLLQLDNFEIFAKWMLGAVFTQLLTLTLVLLDSRG